jgi:hypothetical protein
MDKISICKCCNCGTILVDKNPQADSIKVTPSGREEQMVRLKDKHGESRWCCPNCETDAYLSDDLY